METSLEIAEKDYISRWKINAKQHFDDGDYEWVCDLLKNPPYHRILEIGCGAGYSTLSFLLKKIKVTSIDSNCEAIDFTKKLLDEQGYFVETVPTNGGEPGDTDVLLWKADLVHETEKVKQFVRDQKALPIDLVVLCNPGGQLTTDITEQELAYLLWGGFVKEEIEYNEQAGNVGLLHKWAMIYAACYLAEQMEKPILVVERGTDEEIQETLELISTDTGCRKIFEKFRHIKDAPIGGVKLASVGSSNTEQSWGAALYFPH